MALLSATQGTPERVWSLVNVLAAHRGEMERQALIDWLNPRFLRAGYEAKDERTAVDQTIQAAIGLGLIDTSQRQVAKLVVESVPERYLEFSDIVHETLASLPDDDLDSVPLEVYAWLAVEADVQGSTLWVDGWSSADFAGAVDPMLTPRPRKKEESLFNTSKRATWGRWIEFLGLSTTLPTGEEHPTAAVRLERELLRGDIPVGEEIEADHAIAYIGQRMPYLDGGRVFERMVERRQPGRLPRQLSRLLSAGLRDLNEDGVIKLVVRGDARDNYTLSPDPFSRLNSFGAIVLNAPERTDA